MATHTRLSYTVLSCRVSCVRISVQDVWCWWLPYLHCNSNKTAEKQWTSEKKHYVKGGTRRNKYTIYAVRTVWTLRLGKKFRNFTELNNEHGTLRNITNFTSCWAICQHCIAGLAASNTFPH